jgi:putative SOS response-associated peptidase YedK
MCNLYTVEPTLIEWAQAFDQFLGLELHLSAGADTLANQPWKTTMYPAYQGLFVRPVEAANPTAQLEPAVGRWGLVPFFHKGPVKTFKLSTNNARSETMATSGTFKFSLKERRCIIPATAICEYSGPKGSKTKHAISRADGAPLFLAGLWGSHVWEGETTESYTMVMQDTREGDDMHVFHNRQPLFFDRESVRAWLDLSADFHEVVRSPPAGTLVADPPQPVAA